VDSESYLRRWLTAGVLDEPTAARIRAFESSQTGRSEGLRWPVIVALIFGALLLGAGVLLFVSAHWDELSPNERLSLVVLMVAVFHAAGAATAVRFEALSVTLHTVGTFALGAGIALTGQIFHLSEHWPAAILLWAIGAILAWAILRHWPQAALAAILIPYWLCGEWWYRMDMNHAGFEATIAAGLCALAFTYLTAPPAATVNKALIWIGAIALLPSSMFLAAGPSPIWRDQAIAWLLALSLPLLLAVLLRRTKAVWNLGATLWIVAMALLRNGRPEHLLTYVWCATGTVGLIAWGVREQHLVRINLGMAAFAITVLAYYFSDVMDKLDRSLSLVILGFLFLGGGWLLERTRRHLVAGIQEART
jgi:uncharacterized membrane protein